MPTSLRLSGGRPVGAGRHDALRHHVLDRQALAALVVGALDLVGGGGPAPQEALGERGTTGFTAFTPEQRDALNLIGLLPTGVTTLEGQLHRSYAQFRNATDAAGQVRVPDVAAGSQHRPLLPAARRAPRGDDADRLHADDRRRDPRVLALVQPPPRGVLLDRQAGPDGAGAAGRPVGRTRTSTSSSSPTAKASWASAIRALVASRSVSARRAYTRRPLASTRTG